LISSAAAILVKQELPLLKLCMVLHLILLARLAFTANLRVFFVLSRVSQYATMQCAWMPIHFYVVLLST
jgi:hypothetical protein